MTLSAALALVTSLLPVPIFHTQPVLAAPSADAGNNHAISQAAILVDLDARDLTASSDPWRNHGLLGPFNRIGHPVHEDVAGVSAVTFNGSTDAFLGPETIPALEGSSPRTIEVWVYNPKIDSAEETIVSWGRRGGAAGSMLAFGYGRSDAYGAVTHWADDMGWDGVPRPGYWHHLVYTYDGVVAKVYDNTAEKNSHLTTLSTMRSAISIAAEMSARGALQFKNEYDGGQQAGSLSIASLRIYSTALSPSQIADRFRLDAARFHAVALPSPAKLLEAGTVSLAAGDLKLTLINSTQTPASLLSGKDGFDFLPSDRLTRRLGDRSVHLGDISMRVRPSHGTGNWTEFDSAAHRIPLAATSRTTLASGVLSECSLDPALGASCPLSVKRQWISSGDELILRFTLHNRSTQAVEIGALGAPMAFNNVLSGRRIEEAYTRCSFSDPYIGADAGYLQVVRLSGSGNALLVIPEKGTSFEAYRPIRSDPMPRNVTFEGFYEWMVHTQAYCENEWAGAKPWNVPTSKVLVPDETIQYGFRFVLAPDLRHIESTLIAHHRPVAIGIPGYVIPTDQPASLFLHAFSLVSKITVDPPKALKIVKSETTTPSGYHRYQISAITPGRARLSIVYTDGTLQTVNYFVTPPEKEQVRKLGEFHANKQWYTDPTDPFGRTFSFMPYNRETNSLVLQHPEVWMSGLSDEMGAGPSVAMAMKNLYQPVPSEVALLDTYIDKVLWGRLQLPDYGVRASLFYYDRRALPGFQYKIRGGWDKPRTETTWRAFNYPHVAAVYWSMYRIARDHPSLKTIHPATWYLKQAAETGIAMFDRSGGADGLAQFGLMVGSVFPEILKDLRSTDMVSEAGRFEKVMNTRISIWTHRQYPFGSEMPWDSTGQEEIYTWCRFVHADSQADVTVNAILAYAPSVANWAYNGAARRYFDAPVNGTRWPEIGRMTNHYGSTLNSIPVMSEFREHPEDLYLIRVGYAGMDQIMANIDAEGHGSYGFDATPAILKFDPYTADFGIAFYGYARNAGAYVVHDSEFGWLGFGCRVEENRSSVRIVPTDGFRKRVYIGPSGVWLTLDSGTFENVTAATDGSEILVTLGPTSITDREARLKVTMSTKSGVAHWRYVEDGSRAGKGNGLIVKTPGNQKMIIRLKRIAADSH